MAEGWTPTLRERLIGSWELVEARASGGAYVTLGERPVGRIRYTEAGEVAVQIMAADRPRATPGGYLAYFGTFEVDPATRTVSHTTLGSLVPADTGRTFRRRVVRLDDRRLELAGYSELVGPGGDVRLVWRRLAGG